jgi:hypothetical protein
MAGRSSRKKRNVSGSGCAVFHANALLQDASTINEISAERIRCDLRQNRIEQTAVRHKQIPTRVCPHVPDRRDILGRGAGGARALSLLGL